jgi:guanylate kinase
MADIPCLPEQAFPIVVSGPSGVGKTVLCRELLRLIPCTVRSVSLTTRPPRPGEIDGESYFFCTQARFLQQRDGGELAEWALVHDHYYGTPRAWLDGRLAAGESVVLNIDVQGGLSIRRAYPQALLIFILPPDWRELEQRLLLRETDSEAEIRRRLDTARRELEFLPQYDYAIVNADLEQAVATLISIVRAERRSVRRLFPRGAGPGGHPQEGKDRP